MKFLVPIPDTDYYLWQVLVQITNFREMGYEEDLHIPVIYFKGKPSDRLIKLSTSKELKCHWHLYPNERKKKWYSATMKPYLVAKYFQEFPNERTVTYNYLDPDCIFTKPMDFTPFMVDTNTWFGSETKSYTGEKYIKSKGTELFYDICNVVGINPALIEGKTGWEVGAQYFIKNNDPDIWFEIEDKSAELYKFIKNTQKKYEIKGKKPIQIWCCEMYVTQMVALKRGIELKVSPLMNFHWAGHNISKWYDKPYFHNAGQLINNNKDFHKESFKTSPFRKEIQVVPTSASFNYLKLIRKTEEVFPDLIWEEKQKTITKPMKVLITTASFGSPLESVWAEQNKNTHHIEFRRYDDNNYPFRNSSLTPALKSKFIKTLSHEINPGFDYYIWFDSTISFSRKDLVDEMVKMIGDADLCVFPHRKRNNIKEECDKLIYWVNQKSQKHIKSVSSEQIIEQVKEYCSNPEFTDDKLFYGACFMYSKKLVANSDNMMKAWYYHICRYSIRDMLSLPFVLNKYKPNYKNFEFNIKNNKFFKFDFDIYNKLV